MRLLALAVVALALPPAVWGQEIEWIRQFGSSSDDRAFGIAVDGTGVYVAGEVFGALPGQTSAGGRDSFVAKLSRSGAQVGPGPLATVIPGGLNFGSQPVITTSAPKAVFLRNNGSAPLRIRSIVATTDFAQTNNCIVFSIPPKGFCVINVTFTPTAIGTRFGRVFIFDNAPGSPQRVILRGRGQ